MEKITVLSWMRNEVDMVPFFLRHYAFADELVVWDNESSDGTRELLEADPRVEVREWVTGGVMRDDELTRMKSREYRGTGGGWKFVVDADEFAWHPDMRSLLGLYDKAGVTVPRVEGYDMVSEAMPKDDGRSLMTDLVKEGRPNQSYNKCCVFRESVDVEYGHGAHSTIRVGGEWLMSSVDVDIKLLHYRYMSKGRTVRRAREYVPSKENVALGLGIGNCDVGMMARQWDEAFREKTRVI